MEELKGPGVPEHFSLGFDTRQSIVSFACKLGILFPNMMCEKLGMANAKQTVAIAK